MTETDIKVLRLTNGERAEPYCWPDAWHWWPDLSETRRASEKYLLREGYIYGVCPSDNFPEGKYYCVSDKGKAFLRDLSGEVKLMDWSRFRIRMVINGVIVLEKADE